MRTVALTVRDGGVLLHVGPHKTGTTAIQASLASARKELLRTFGVLYPGTGENQHTAAAAAIGHSLGWDYPVLEPIPWLQLRYRVRTHRRRVVISSEMFAEATPDAAARIVRQLGRNRVQVAITLRPLEQLLASTWQQYVKAGIRVRYETWLHGMFDGQPEHRTAKSFWLRNDHAALVRRWAAVVGAENVVLVVVDPRDRRALFDAFEDLLALPRNTLNPTDEGPSNRSLSLPEVEVLLRLNRRVGGRIARPDYIRVLKNDAVRQLIETRVPGPREARLSTPAWAIERAREFSRKHVADIATSGVHIVGDLASLAPDGPLPVDEPGLQRARAVPAQLAADFALDVLEAGLRERDQPVRTLVRRLTGRH